MIILAEEIRQISGAVQARAVQCLRGVSEVNAWNRSPRLIRLSLSYSMISDAPEATWF